MGMHLAGWFRHTSLYCWHLAVELPGPAVAYSGVAKAAQLVFVEDPEEEHAPVVAYLDCQSTQNPNPEFRTIITQEGTNSRDPR